MLINENFYHYFSLFILQVFSQEIDLNFKFAEAFSEYQQKLEPLISSIEALSSTEAVYKIPEIIENLKKVKAETNSLITLLQESTLSISLYAQNKANLETVQKSIDQIEIFLEKFKLQVLEEQKLEAQINEEKTKSLPTNNNTDLHDRFSDLALYQNQDV